jgi:hypothetical protein
MKKSKIWKKKIHIRFDIWKIDTAISTFRIFVAWSDTKYYFSVE